MKHISPIIVLIFTAWLIDYLCSRPGIQRRHLRGVRLVSGFGLTLKLLRYRFQSDTLVFGNLRLPAAIAGQGILTAGPPGSGKTVVQQLLLKNELNKPGGRYFVYDGKGDLMGIVEGMKKLWHRLITFDPFLVEGVRWAIWKDVVDAASCNQIARILFPKADNEHQPFFPESVQNIAAAIMLTFVILKVQGWRLSHLLYILRSEDRIRQVLDLTPRGRDTLANLSHTGETWGNIMATLANRINDYEIVAALWDNAAEEYSMREWAKEEDVIVVLRKSATCSEVIDCMNRVLFTMAKRYLLNKTAYPRERSWVVLDELASFGGKPVIKELALLLEQGRSRNVANVLGIQTIASLRDELGVYGADRIMGICSTKAMMRAEDHASAEWHSGFFGEAEEEVRTTSRATSSSSGQGGSSSSTSTNMSVDHKRRPVVLPSQFQAIPKADLQYGIEFYGIAPVGRPPIAYHDHVRGRTLRKTLTFAPQVDRPLRPDDQQLLAVTDQDIDQLLGGRLSTAAAAAAAAAPGTNAPTGAATGTNATASPGAAAGTNAPGTNVPATGAAPKAKQKAAGKKKGQAAAATAPGTPAPTAGAPPGSNPPGATSGTNNTGSATSASGTKASASSGGSGQKPRATRKPTSQPAPGPATQASQPVQTWNLAQGTTPSQSGIWNVKRQK